MGKAYADYTISDVIRLKPKWLMEAQSDPTKFNEMLDRLGTMMDFGFNYIAEYPFLDVFGGTEPEKRDVSHMDTTAVNKALHEYKERKEAGKEPRVFEIKRGNISGLMQAYKDGVFTPNLERIRSSIRSETNNIGYYERELADYSDKIASYERMRMDKRDQIRSTEVILEGLKDSLERASKSKYDPTKIELLKNIPNHWRVFNLSRTGFFVVRMKPLVMKYTNHQAGVNRTLYMGFFGFEFSWDLQCLRSFPVADYYSTGGGEGGKIHPHVCGNHICWGNVQSRADRFASEGNSEAFFTLLDTVLETYAPDNPYRSFDAFESDASKDEHYRAVSDWTSHIEDMGEDNFTAALNELRHYASERFEVAYRKRLASTIARKKSFEDMNAQDIINLCEAAKRRFEREMTPSERLRIINAARMRNPHIHRMLGLPPLSRIIGRDAMKHLGTKSAIEILGHPLTVMLLLGTEEGYVHNANAILGISCNAQFGSNYIADVESLVYEDDEIPLAYSPYRGLYLTSIDANIGVRRLIVDRGNPRDYLAQVDHDDRREAYCDACEEHRYYDEDGDCEECGESIRNIEEGYDIY